MIFSVATNSWPSVVTPDCSSAISTAAERCSVYGAIRLWRITLGLADSRAYAARRTISPTSSAIPVRLVLLAGPEDVLGGVAALAGAVAVVDAAAKPVAETAILRGLPAGRPL